MLFGAPDRCTYKSQLCSSLSDVMEAPTSNKTHYIMTISCVEILYVEVNVCDGLHRAETSDGRRQRHYSPCYKTLYRPHDWSCFFKEKKQLHDVALSVFVM